MSPNSPEATRLTRNATARWMSAPRMSRGRMPGNRASTHSASDPAPATKATLNTTKSIASLLSARAAYRADRQIGWPAQAGRRSETSGGHGGAEHPKRPQAHQEREHERGEPEHHHAHDRGGQVQHEADVRIDQHRGGDQQAHRAPAGRSPPGESHVDPRRDRGRPAHVRDHEQWLGAHDPATRNVGSVIRAQIASGSVAIIGPEVPARRSSHHPSPVSLTNTTIGRIVSNRCRISGRTRASSRSVTSTTTRSAAYPATARSKAGPGKGTTSSSP